MYGIGRGPTDSYGRSVLIARRLVERGVRFAQLYINGQIWDNHTGLATDMKAACDRTDLPIAGLLSLKQRGLSENSLVVWGGEFGRLPIAQLPADKDERKAGRDHNKNAFSVWMSGADNPGRRSVRRMKLDYQRSRGVSVWPTGTPLFCMSLAWIMISCMSWKTA